MIRRILPFILVLALVALAVPVQAQQGIAVLESTATVKFPDSFSFKVRAESAAEIAKIVLRYKVDKVSPFVVTSEAIPTFTPGRRVEAAWTWDMRKAGGMPPGAKVEYSWLIEDRGGNRVETASAVVEFSDARYSWQSLSAGMVTLYWYRGDKPFAQKLMDAAIAALDTLAKDTGARLEKAVSIYIYGSSEDLKGALVFPQEWTGGVAFTEYGIVAIGIAPNNLEWGKGAVAHELAHLVVHQMTYNSYGPLPTWLNEGLAMYAEGELDSFNQSLLRKAISEDKLFSVRSLASSFPASGDDATLAYAQSHSLTEFLVAKYGRGKMLELLGVFKKGSAYDEALRKVYGFDTAGLDDLWRSSLGLKPRPTPVAPTPTPQPVPTLVPFGTTPTPTLEPAPEVPKKEAATPEAERGLPRRCGAAELRPALAALFGLFLVYRLRWARQSH